MNETLQASPLDFFFSDSFSRKCHPEDVTSYETRIVGKFFSPNASSSSRADNLEPCLSPVHGRSLLPQSRIRGFRFCVWQGVRNDSKVTDDMVVVGRTASEAVVESLGLMSQI